MPRGVHGEKLYAAMNSAKLPATDKPRLKAALDKYDVWIEQVNDADAPTLEELIKIMVSLLQEYKYYIDVTLIFDSPNDFLYRQKGQTKIDNTVIEEFLPVFVRKCLIKQYGQCDLVIGTQQKVFSSAFFDSSLGSPQIGGGLVIKQKDQDFSMSRELFIRSSFDPSFSPNETKTWTTNRICIGRD